jgi:hypothetical protein
MYDALGVFAIGWIMLSPIIRAVRFALPGAGSDDLPLTIVFAGLLMMCVLDSLMNAAIILPYLLIAGALSPQWSVAQAPERKDAVASRPNWLLRSP